MPTDTAPPPPDRLDVIPDPQVVADRLSRAMREAAILRRLLRLSLTAKCADRERPAEVRA